MNLKQIEGVGKNLAAVFILAFMDAIYSVVTLGPPRDWPAVRAIIGRASLAGIIAVFGWLKMHRPAAVSKESLPAQTP